MTDEVEGSPAKTNQSECLSDVLWKPRLKFIRFDGMHDLLKLDISSWTQYT